VQVDIPNRHQDSPVIHKWRKIPIIPDSIRDLINLAQNNYLNAIPIEILTFARTTEGKGKNDCSGANLGIQANSVKVRYQEIQRFSSI
jgi:hypothetical protein